MEQLPQSPYVLGLLHPILVHFPIAFLSAAALFEALWLLTKRERLAELALWMIHLGALGTAAASMTGWLAADALGHGAPGRDLVHGHRNLMLSMSVGLVLTSLAMGSCKGLRAGPARQGLLAILLVLFAVMAVGADKGRLLVYRHGVGVDARAFQQPGAAARP